MILKNRWIHPFLQIILVQFILYFNRPTGVQNSKCGKELNKSCSPNSRDDLCIVFCMYASSRRSGCQLHGEHRAFGSGHGSASVGEHGGLRQLGNAPVVFHPEGVGDQVAWHTSFPKLRAVRLGIKQGCTHRRRMEREAKNGRNGWIHPILLNRPRQNS